MDWQTLRNQFMRDTGGDLPGGQLEQQLIDAYAQHPTAVERATEKIALGHAAGKIRSPWGALKTEVERAINQANNPTHEQGHDREKAVARAEQRIRNELLHYDRTEEIMDELFGPRGTVRNHDTPALRERLEALWNDLRPLGQLVEHEANERGHRYQTQRAALKEALTDPKTQAKIKSA
jgi:hypothetical protein